MIWILQAVITATITFAATNIDDIFVLMLFFSQTGREHQRWHIVAGQYLGFTLLVLISLIGFIAGLVVPRVWIGLLGIVPIIIGVRHWLGRKREADIEAREEAEVRGASHATAFSSVMGVAAVTFANGGDNIGIYTPLFASSDLPRMVVILAVFYVLVAVWCVLGYMVTRHRAFAHVLTHYGHVIVPFVLIALGLYIMLESETFKLLGFWNK